MKRRNIVVGGLALSMLAGNALGDVVEVTAVATKFVPSIVTIKPGDTVKWTNMAGHDTVSIEGMIPDGAQGWKSQMGEDYTVTLETPGAYVYKCSPHVSLGMTGTVVVGEGIPENFDKIKASPENKAMIGRQVRELEKSVAGQ